jgi:hypothetical protein
MKISETDRSMKLRVEEWIEVRSAEEILATLDGDQCASALPFMPEMLQYCGKRFRVYKSAHKTADTSEHFTIRRMANAVHLNELRCDGSAHGGCQAGCLLFWKETWIERVPGPAAAARSTDKAPAPLVESQPGAVIRDALARGTTCPGPNGAPERYRCQATQILKATIPVRRRERWDPRFYIKDLTSGNVKPYDFIRFGALAMLTAFIMRWFGIAFVFPGIRGLAGQRTPTLELNLRPGELVRVRSKDEIKQTLNSRRQNRGMWFDAEMVVYCGKGPFRVLRRVDKIVNEKTGQLMNLENPCIILEGVTCSGNYLHNRMFSPRHEYPFWREIWLERVIVAKNEASGSSWLLPDGRRS